MAVYLLIWQEVLEAAITLRKITNLSEIRHRHYCHQCIQIGTQREDSDDAIEQSTLSIPSSSTIHPVLQETDVNRSTKILMSLCSPNMVSNVSLITKCNQKKYYISPIHSGQSDFDDSDYDPHFVPDSKAKLPICFEVEQQNLQVILLQEALHPVAHHLVALHQTVQMKEFWII